MAKYLITGSYTSQGTKGVLQEGGSGRKAAVEKALREMGGRLEAIYYAFGETDVVVIADVPDTTSALALSLAVNASGAITIRTTPLLTVEEVMPPARRWSGIVRRVLLRSSAGRGRPLAGPSIVQSNVALDSPEPLGRLRFDA